MTETVSCHCGRRYLTQAQADLCPHVRPEPEPVKPTGLGNWATSTPYWVKLPPPQEGVNIDYHAINRIPRDGFHGGAIDTDA